VEVVGSGSLYLKLNVSYTHTDELVFCVPGPRLDVPRVRIFLLSPSYQFLAACMEY
jgi:hypothetical protein